jgi:hypothetical protein
MPRTLPAALTTAMDSGVYEPYIRVVLQVTSGTYTVQPISYTLENLRATIKIALYHSSISEEGAFRIVRGAVINGTPVTISSIWFTLTDTQYDGKYVTYTGEPLKATYLQIASGADYETVIDAALAGDDAAVHVANYEGSASWKSYQFYPDGKDVALSPRKKLFSMLQQKYLIFAVDDGFDGTDSNIFFFVATQTRTKDYDITDTTFNSNLHVEFRRLVWKDETDTVHELGDASYQIYNLGYLESTADSPATLTRLGSGNSFVGSKSSKLPVHLKYRTGDFVHILADGGMFTMQTRINVTEVLDINSTPSWYQIVEPLVFFDVTAGGAVPAGTEPIPKTITSLFTPRIRDYPPDPTEFADRLNQSPLSTGPFTRILSFYDNNLQTAMETLDEHTHAYSNITGTPTIREVLTANRTYYVRTDGSDSNNGLANTAGGAFLTIQKAINTIAALDISTYDVTIQVGDGTYTGTATVNGPWVGSGTVTLSGNLTTPSNVLLNSAGSCIVVQSGGRLTVQGMRLQAAGGCLVATTNGFINMLTKIEFGTTSFAHVYVSMGGNIASTSNYSIVGGAPVHMQAESGGDIQFILMTVTLTGTPNFAAAFAVGGRAGIVESYMQTFSGSATGARYSAAQNSVIFTNGGGANYFPGNAAGSTTTGGQYT